MLIGTDTVTLLEKTLMKAEALWKEHSFDKPEFRLAQKVCLLIANLKVAYQGQLEESMDLVKPFVEKASALLDKKPVKFEEMDALNKALVMPHHLPRVADMALSFGKHPVVTIQGNFQYATSYTPKLKVQNTTYDAVSAKEDTLIFALDKTDLTEVCSHLTASLVIDWKSGYVPYYSWTTSFFQLPIKLPPRSPGVFEAVVVKTSDETHPQSELVQIAKNKTDLTLKFPAHNGYTIDPSSAKFYFVDKVGDLILKSLTPSKDSVDAVIDRSKGRGRGQITYNETMKVEAPSRKVPLKDLKWGDTWKAELQESERVSYVTFTSFTGQKVTLLPGQSCSVFQFTGAIQVKSLQEYFSDCCVENKGTKEFKETKSSEKKD